jgi:hypothetical protein
MGSQTELCSPNAAEVQKRYYAVSKNLEKEEKFKDATAKMVSASQGEIKKRAQAELEESMRRIKSLKVEKAALERSLGALSESVRTS